MHWRLKMSKIGVVARVVAKPGKEDMALEELQRMVAPTLQEPGCIKYVLHRNINNPNDFWFVEEWETLEHLTKHKETPHYLRLSERKSEFAQSGEVIVLSALTE
jgi:quinol monooxygenase YgiN